MTESDRGRGPDGRRPSRGETSSRGRARARNEPRDGRSGGGSGASGTRAGGGAERRDPRTGRPRPRTRTDEREPALPEDITGHELDREVRAELRSLAKDNAEMVARHLVAAGRLLDTDPDAAYAHAMAAQRRAGRIGAVREAAGLAAYLSGRFDEALREMRAARRILGSDEWLPLIADAERGLGRPERALQLAAAPEVARLDRAGQMEMRIVAAGARRDLGQLDAAVVTLQVPELGARGRYEWLARLRYAYADALLAAGRPEEAHTWFRRAAQADDPEQPVTDAADRISDLEGAVFVDVLEEPEPERGPSHDDNA